MLRLGVHGLTQAETGLVRAYLALAGAGPAGAGWTLVSTGPCDAVLVDAAEPSPRQVQQARGAHALALLGQPLGAIAFPVLARPLQAERLERWLAASFGQPRAEPREPAATGLPQASTRFRLRRWPPAQLLRSQAPRLRMATVLSRRHLNAGELAKLTGQAEAECQRFIQLLQGFQLLDAQAPDDLPQRAAAPAAVGAVRPSLLQSIRRRLGLWT